MRIASVNEVAVDISTPHCRARWLVEEEPHAAGDRAIGILELETGYAQEFDGDDDSERAIIVLTGEAILRTGDGEQRVTAGAVIAALRNASYAIRADSAATVLTVQSRRASSAVVAESPATVTGAPVRVLQLRDVPAQEFHIPDRGLFHISSRQLVSAEAFGSRSLFVGHTTVAAEDGLHTLHRHPSADEFVYILGGVGEHIAEDETVPMPAGTFADIPANEWHGFRSTGQKPTELIFCYLGVASFAEAGEEVKG